MIRSTSFPLVRWTTKFLPDLSGYLAIADEIFAAAFTTENCPGKVEKKQVEF
jgi:hypothetical protein